MLKKLQQRWKVSATRAALILITFALGGSICGKLASVLLKFTGLDKGVLWVISYVLLATLIWPICVIVVSIPFGQFTFFKNYLARMYARMSGKKNYEEQQN